MPSISITTPEVLQRNWGEEIIVTFTPTHAGKVLKRKAGTKGGFQFHIKEENHYVYEGSLLLRAVEDGTVVERIVSAGMAWTVPPMAIHQEEALADCVVLEVSDPTREDRYGIVPDPGALPSMTDATAVEKLTELADAFRRRAVDCDHLATAIRLMGLKSFAQLPTTTR